MSHGHLSFPITDFRKISQACRADEPLEPGSQRYCDLKALRADSSVVDELADSLFQEMGEGEFHRGILSGHRGSGKSTELLQFKEWADANGFLCLHIEVDTYLGTTHLEFSDLYLLAVQHVEKAMVDLGIPLPSSKLNRVIEWFAQVTKLDLEKVKSEIDLTTGAEIGGGVPLLGKLWGRFSAGVAANSEHQLEARRVFRQAPDQLIDLANDLIRSAQDQLLRADETNLRRANGLLLLFDNLDRYPIEAIERLLTRGATLMRHLACHAVYTIPVELRCRAGNIYADEYDGDFILPMPSLRLRDKAWAESVEQTEFDEASVALLRQLLEQRLVISELFESESDAIQLIKMSGGCVRDLMHLVTAARQRSGNRHANPAPQKITSEGVQRAIRDMRDNRSESLQETDYGRLVQIARREAQAQQLDDLTLQFLGKRCVLQYKDEQGRWLDIHPLLIEARGFRRAWDSPDAASTAPVTGSNDGAVNNG